jgi:hypothetical protein
MRRLIAILVILVVVALAWAGGWFALAAWARGQVSTVLAEVAARGVEVDCSGRDIVGFPLRCGLPATRRRLRNAAAGRKRRWPA